MLEIFFVLFLYSEMCKLDHYKKYIITEFADFYADLLKYTILMHNFIKKTNLKMYAQIQNFALLK